MTTTPRMITVSAKFNAIVTAVFMSIAAAQYGIDVSFPVQHKFTQGEYLQKSRSVFGDDRINVYNDYVVGCIKEYTPKGQGHFCHANEEERLKYNVNQPPTMTNYTDIGYLKTRLSEKTFAMILDFWEDEKKRADEIPGSLRDEDWPPGNTYTNHWSSPTKIVFIHGKRDLTETIYEEVRSSLKEWIPQVKDFSRSSLYGIRVYTSGSMLATHVDRDPLISSAIINVDQSVTEPWPLEVYGHDGMAYNITLEPGEMILYESHSLLHGRPFALQGDFYANIFVHFKPIFDDDAGEDTSEGEENEEIWEEEVELEERDEF